MPRFLNLKTKMVLFSKNALTKAWLLQSQRSVLAGTKTASTRNFTYFIKPIEKPFRKGAPIEEQKGSYQKWHS